MDAKVERIKFSDGCIARNGVSAIPNDESYFVSRRVAVLHFKEEDWHKYGGPYPEIAPVAYRRPIEEFCFPRAGEYELFRNKNGEIELGVFISGVQTPVLEWILPEATKVMPDIYAAFIAGI